MRRRSGWAAGLALSLSLSVGLVGCGEGSPTTTPLVEDEDVETLLVQRQRERNPRLRVGEAKCPEDVVARQGESFECSVDVEGEAAGFEVTVSEVLGQNVTYDFRPVQAIVDVAGVADYLRSRLEPEWRTAQVDCGRAKVRLMDVGTPLECTAFNGTTTRYIQAVVEDRNGTVALQER